MPFGKRRPPIFDNQFKYPNAREVKISVMFTRLAEIDTINERFSCEATLFVTWRETSNFIQKCESREENIFYYDSRDFWDPQLYIDNAIGDVKEKDVKYRVERFFDELKKEWFLEVHMIKRIQGTFFEKLELYHFPFDVQDLSITLTSHRTMDEINIVQDYKIPPKMTKSASLDKHIWKLYDHVNIKMHTIKNDLPPSSGYSTEEFDTACSHPAITMQCRVSRKPGYFIINCLLPTLMITLCVFFTFMMDYQRFQYRFSLLFTTMLTSITFRWAIHGRVLPTISYMTFLDVYCVSSIMIVFSAMVWHAMYLVIYKKDESLAEKWDLYAMIAFAVVVVLVHIMQAIWFVIAFRKRLDLERLDKRAALNYLKARTSMHSNNANSIKAPFVNSADDARVKKLILESKSNLNNFTTSSLESKRLLYSFSKLDDSSVKLNKACMSINDKAKKSEAKKLMNDFDDQYRKLIKTDSASDATSTTTSTNLNTTNRNSGLLTKMNSTNSNCNVDECFESNNSNLNRTNQTCIVNNNCNNENMNKNHLVSCLIGSLNGNEDFEFNTSTTII